MKNTMRTIFIFPILLFIIISLYEATLEKTKLVLLAHKATYDEAVRICKENNTSLLKIENAASNEVAYEYAKEVRIESYWIDANDRKSENDWSYEDGKALIYKNWQSGQPDNFINEDCAHGSVEKNGKWNDISCTRGLSVLCITNVSQRSISNVTKNEDSVIGSFTNKRLILLPKAATHETAVDLCKEKKMNLVKIQDTESDKIVFEFAKEHNIQYYWIDANDRNTEGEWQYSDGKKIRYTNWQQCQPDNSNNEDCAHGSVKEDGKWNDIFCCRKMSVICMGDIICKV